MTFLLALGSAIPPQVPRSCSVGVILIFFVKHTMIPEVQSELDSHANIFGASD